MYARFLKSQFHDDLLFMLGFIIAMLKIGFMSVVLGLTMGIVVVHLYDGGVDWNYLFSHFR